MPRRDGPDNGAWRALDPASREREYSPSSCIGGDYRPFIADYVRLSAAARAKPPSGARVHLDLACGEGARQRLDLFVPAGPAAAAAAPPPLLAFIHGGYWQELSKGESSFAAADALAQGLAFAAIDYTLAPAATVAAMVDECRAALAWLKRQAATFGFDGGRIVVAGSSAGAHLAAMCALRPSRPSHPSHPSHPSDGPVGEPALVQGAVLVSGVYEVEPLVGTSINEALGLDEAGARAVSPALMDLAGFPPAVVCWGEVETGEFKRQSRDFAAALRRAGGRCQELEVPVRNHFDVILDLADPATPLGAATLALVRSL